MLFKEYYDLEKETKSFEREYNLAMKDKENLIRSLTITSNPEREQTSNQANYNSNIYPNYLAILEDLDKAIELTKNLWQEKKYYLKLKEIDLRNSKDELDRIYVYEYIDKLSMLKISIKIGCSLATSYRKLKIIEDFLHREKK